MQYVTRFALANPDKNITLIHNRENVLQLRKESFRQRIISIFGESFSSNLIPVSFQSNFGSVRGVIGTPQQAQQSSIKQFLFVNNRPITDKYIAQAVKQAYSNLLDVRSFPVFVLLLDILPELVDVNIHPRKEAVRFVNQQNLFKELQAHIEQTLSEKNLTYQQNRNSWEIQEAGMDRHTAKFVKETENTWDVREVSIEDDVEILQVHNCYLILQSKQGILILDQHAAHERILYEQFKEVFESRRNEVFSLPEPILFSLSPADGSLLEEHMLALNEIGFEIDLFGEADYRITKIPAVYGKRNIKELILELISDFASENAQKIDSVTERTLAFLACRSAIKAGDVLTPEQRRKLVDKLHQTKTHYTCPHGRPVQVQIPLKELDKMFKRR